MRGLAILSLTDGFGCPLKLFEMLEELVLAHSPDSVVKGSHPHRSTDSILSDRLSASHIVCKGYSLCGPIRNDTRYLFKDLSGWSEWPLAVPPSGFPPFFLPLKHQCMSLKVILIQYSPTDVNLSFAHIVIFEYVGWFDAKSFFSSLS